MHTPDDAKSHETAKVERIVRQVVADNACDVFSLRIIPFHRVFLTIERVPGTPPIDEIARIHKRISRTMEAEGCNWEAYVIDVTTPGVHRALRDPGEFAKFIGKRVRVKRRGVLPAEMLVTGELLASDDRGCRIHAEGKGPVDLSWSEIEGGHLEPRLPF